MPGIYIHIPFCKQKCHYCDFYKSTETQIIPKFLQSLKIEIRQKKQLFPSIEIETLYIGGGTPSLLSPKQLESIFQCLQENYQFSRNPEITIEVNPDDLNLEYLKALKHIGINRLSIGIQSFDEEMLKFLNRRHNAKQAISSIDMAVKAGFDNISIDVIYGIPGLSINLWKENLSKMHGLPLLHVSAYHLTIEKDTFFGKLHHSGKLKEVDDEMSWDQYQILCNTMQELQLEHYEISNFAKQAMYSRHNTSYWSQVPYLGLGPSAHSYTGSSRIWNHSNLRLYNEKAQRGEIMYEQEFLSTKDRYNEYLMTRLRTFLGCERGYVEQNFGREYWLGLINQIMKPELENYFSIMDHRVFLKREHWFISDTLISKLFII